MKKFVLMGTLILLGFGSIKAEEATSGLGLSSTVTPIIRKKGTREPVYRKFEVRAGPRMSFLTGSARIGEFGTKTDIWDDLRWDSPNVGFQLGTDWQPYSRFHVMMDLAYDNFDQRGNTRRALSRNDQNPGEDILNAGSEISAHFQTFTIDAKLGWDAIHDQTFRVQPHVGLKAGYTSGDVKVSGTATSSAGLFRSPVDYKKNINFGEVILTGGFDLRAYLSRSVYVGADTDTSIWSNYVYVGGDLYAGWDISKAWGIRMGYDYNWLDNENKSKSVALSPLLGALYVQAVWGF